ncbi:MAG: hypothetical protein VR73_07725 [Gammaproteobacteria bacterium BRH_c0]|nr:MAG: hypothetical protein VR73_07725 [Gammaproteobacteria bacterium BRH_c0]
MNKVLPALILTLSALLLAACQPYSLVRANNPVKLNGYSVTPGEEWNKASYKLGPKAVTWTSNGEVLDQLILIGDIGSGEALFKNTNKNLPMPPFTSDMMPFDVETLVKTSLKNSANGEVEVNTENLQPANFGGKSGFRFNISFYTASGLLKSGDVLGAVKDGKLYLMIYSAADLHYYKSKLPEVEKVFASVII